MRRRRTPETIAGRVNADGSIAAGDGFTVVASGFSYTITFASGFRLISLVPTVTSAGVTSFAHPNTYTDRSVIVTTFNTAGTGGAQAFSFVAVGVQQ